MITITQICAALLLMMIGILTLLMPIYVYTINARVREILATLEAKKATDHAILMQLTKINVSLNRLLQAYEIEQHPKE